MVIVILKVYSGYKSIEKHNKNQMDSEIWICRMMKANNFVYGYTDNGRFAAISELCSEYLKSENR